MFASSIRLTLVLTSLALTASAQDLPVLEGPAPDPTIGTEKPLGLSKLRGRVVVVEFFSPACPGCAAMQEKTNQRIEKLADDYLTYIYVSDSPAGPVQSYAAKHPISDRIRVVKDEGSAIQQAYGSAQTPHSYVIDPNGRIAAITHPHHLEPSVLEAVRDGKSFDVPFIQPKRHADLEWERSLGLDSKQQRFSTMVLIRESQADLAWMGYREDGAFVGDGITWANLIQTAFATPASSVEFADDAEAARRFSFLIRSPSPSDDAVRTHLRAIIQEHFGDRLALTDVTQKGLILAATPDARPEPARGRTPAVSKWHNGHVVDEGVTMSRLVVRFALFELGRTAEEAIDTTGWLGHYSVDLQFEPGDLASINRALGGMGLKLFEGEAIRTNVKVGPKK